MFFFTLNIWINRSFANSTQSDIYFDSLIIFLFTHKENEKEKEDEEEKIKLKNIAINYFIQLLQSWIKPSN